RTQALHTGCVYLGDQDIGKAIYDQTGQAVPFGMDQAIGVRLCEIKHAPQRYCLANASAQKIGIDQLFRVTRQDANSDIGVGVIVAARNELSVCRFYIDEPAGFDPVRGLLQRARKYPQVSTLQTLLAMRFEARRRVMNRRHDHQFSLNSYNPSMPLSHISKALQQRRRSSREEFA